MAQTGMGDRSQHDHVESSHGIRQIQGGALRERVTDGDGGGGKTDRHRGRTADADGGAHGRRAPDQEAAAGRESKSDPEPRRSGRRPQGS